jgi:hypothetical protein
MGDPPPLKRPKLEKDDYESSKGDDDADITEEAVLALIAHRERDVERCKLKLLHYQSLARSFPSRHLACPSPLCDDGDDNLAILPAAGHRGDEAGGGAGAARPLPRSQAAAEPEGTQAAGAAREEAPPARARQEGSLALAAAGGEAAASHPGAQRPAGPARSAAPSGHAWTEEGRRRVVIFISGVLILVSGAAGADKDGGQEAQEKDRYRPFSCL